DPVAAPELTHEPHRLAQAREPLPEFGPVLLAGAAEPGRDLIEGLARAEAGDDAMGVEASEARERLREHGGVVPERRRHHAGADLHRRRALADRGPPPERERGMSPGRAPRVEGGLR